MENLSIFADRLEMLMSEKNVDVATLSSVLGVNSTSVYAYLRNVQFPSFKHLVTLANYFNCTTDFLLGLEDENQSSVFYDCPPFQEQLKILKAHYDCPWRHFYINAKIPENTFYNWKNGRFDPTVNGIIALARSLRCSVDFLIGRAKY